MPTSDPTAPMNKLSSGSVTIQAVRWRDGQFLRQVRNHPQVMLIAGNRPVGWVEHWWWFVRLRLLWSDHAWIGSVNGERAGYIRVLIGLNCWVISLAILPCWWRYGIGLKMLRWVETDRDLTDRQITLWAEVEYENVPSRRLFERAGFVIALPVVLPEELVGKSHTLWYKKD